MIKDWTQKIYQGMPVRYYQDGNRSNPLDSQVILIKGDNKFRLAYVDKDVEMHEFEPIGNNHSVVIKISTDVIPVEDMEQMASEHNCKVVAKDGYVYTLEFANPVDAFWLGCSLGCGKSIK